MEHAANRQLIFVMDTLEEINAKIRKYCAYQDRAEKEVVQRLKLLGATEKEITDILPALQEEAFIDDDRFTRNYVRGKLNLKQWGKLKIKSQLVMKGIASDIIKKYLSDIPDEQYEDLLDETIRKWKKTHNISEQKYVKLYRHLLSKGYENSVIISKLKMYDRED